MLAVKVWQQFAGGDDADAILEEVFVPLVVIQRALADEIRPVVGEPP